MRIAHLSDTHLRVKHLGLDIRGLDFYHAFRDAITKGAALGVDLFLHTGDVFHEPSLKSKIATVQITAIHDLLKQLGIPMLVIEGNHEQADPPQLNHPYFNPSPMPGDRKFTPLPGITLLNSSFATFQGVTIFGVGSSSTEEFHATLVKELDKLEPEDHGRLADILLCHMPIREFCGFPNPSAITLEQMPLDHFGLILVGDIHQWDYREYPDRMCRYIGYPGATELDKSNDPLENFIAIFDVVNGSELPYWPIFSAPTQVRIDSLQKYAFQINDEAGVEEVLGKLRAITGRAMVFVRFDSRIPACAERLNAVVDHSRIIFRPLPIGQFGDVVTPENLGAATNRDRDLKDILHRSYSADMEKDANFVGVTEAFLTRGADFSALLTDYIEKELACD